MRVALVMPASKLAPAPRPVAAPRMMSRRCRALQEIGALIIAGGCGVPAVKEVAALVQRTCGYRWVGIYKISRGDFIIQAATGETPPAYARFPISQGISAEAVETRRTVVVRDVRKDKRFLPNFWTTKSEIIVPIIDDEHDRVVGVINVESSELDAFGKTDRDFLEGVARMVWRAFR
jgi:putative methionine-R-sulfoxide reductase with GAF domain